MPQAVPYIIAFFKIAVVRQLLITVALTLLQRALTKRPSRGSFPINVSIRTPITERRLIIGTVRAGGAFLFVRSSPPSARYLWYVVAYATHQCQALKDCWLDKFRIPAADINGSTGDVSTATLDGKLKIWDHLGTQAQTADTNLDTALTAWTSNHRLRGICYRVLRFEKSTKAFPSGAPQMVTSLIDGALLYDPRLDSTNGGSGSHRTDNPSTWAFSRNWALGLRWYLSGGSMVNDQATRQIVFGLQESDSRIDDAYTIAAANIADQSLSGANAPPSGAEVRYQIDIEVSCGQFHRDILEEILMAGGPGQLINVHGKWRMYAGAYDAPIHTFTQDDLAEGLDIEDTTGDEERANTISAIFVNSEREWNEDTSQPRTNAAYITQDGGQVINDEVQLRGVTRQYAAQRITERMLRDGRQMRRVRFPFKRQGAKVAPWETFSFSSERYGWNSRVFRCIERDPQRNEDGGEIYWITGKAVAASIDTDLVTADYDTGTSATSSVQSEEPDAPTALTAVSLLRAIQFNWSLPEFWALNGVVELWEYTANTPFASATKIWEGRGTSVVIQKNDFTTRYYWARLRTIGNQFSTTEPSGNGLAAVALPAVDIVSDPQFVLATDETHWWKYNPSGGSAATITLSGGAMGGYASIPGAGLTTPVYIVSRRPLPYQCAKGEVYTVTLRARIPSSLSGLLYANVVRHARSYSNSTFGGTEEEALGGLYIAAASIGSDWTEFVGLCFVRDLAGTDGADIPLCSAIVGTIVATSGSVDVDLVSVQPGALCAPENKVYTATSNDLASSISEYFKNLQYDNASAGSITLPFAELEHAGARIYFEQIGAGVLTVQVQGGDTLQSVPGTTGSRALQGQHARAFAEVVDASTWKITGQLA